MNDQFSGEFAVGEVYGIRAFRVDDYGRLRAINVEKAKPWMPGVNVAECHKSEMSYTPPGHFYMPPLPLPGQTVNLKRNPDGTTTFEITNDPKPKAEAEAEKQPETPKTHDAPDESCKCGFYAYLDENADEVKAHGLGLIGIVKAYGRVLLGTKGFRAEKAEIVALRSPTRGGKKTYPLWVRQEKLIARAYPDVPLLPNIKALLEFAPLTEAPALDVTAEDFWTQP